MSNENKQEKAGVAKQKRYKWQDYFTGISKDFLSSFPPMSILPLEQVVIVVLFLLATPERYSLRPHAYSKFSSRPLYISSYRLSVNSRRGENMKSNLLKQNVKNTLGRRQTDQNRRVRQQVYRLSLSESMETARSRRRDGVQVEFERLQFSFRRTP